MADLKQAILDAKYIDMISLGDFVVRDCGLPDMDGDGNLMPQATEIAAALFRWAADMQASAAAAAVEAPVVEDDADDLGDDAPEEIAAEEILSEEVVSEDVVAEAVSEEAEADMIEDVAEAAPVQEYDENGDPILDVEEAERLESAIATKQETE